MTKTSRAPADADIDALIRLGAKEISEVRGGLGALVGYDLEPAIDMAGYPAALAEVEADRLAARWAALRAERNRRIAACDWTQMPDAPLTDAQRKAWAAHRQALRDLPKATKDPAAPVWPKPPA